MTQSFLALKMKLVNGRRLETSNAKEVEIEHEEESTEAAEWETEGEDKAAAVPLVTYVNNVSHSIFPNVEWSKIKK